jgi:uncharacterized phage-like protein YoqJ
MKACFIGHRTVEKTEELMASLKEIVLSLIKEGVVTFLFGSKSEFNHVAWEVVTELKKEYTYVKRVYVRSISQYIEKSYKEYLLKFYEETYFPEKLERAGRYSYVERNYEMIDNSAYCIFYYNENKETPKYGTLLPKKRSSGTKIAYEYARKKKKRIINVYK